MRTPLPMELEDFKHSLKRLQKREQIWDEMNPTNHMKRIYLLCLLSVLFLTAFSQNKMRPVEELINTKEPGWILVKEWIDSATNKIEILPCDKEKARDALYKTQVTTRSPMGSLIYSTGGLLIDNGWIRILGSGSTRLNRSLPDWNKGKTFAEFGQHSPFLLIADDAVGGFFALNGGGLGNDLGSVYYLAPDNLKWQDLEMTYTDFLWFCFTGDLNEFYTGLRWTNWTQEVNKLDGNKAYSFYPFLWSPEGKDINKDSRRPVPVEEVFTLRMTAQLKLGEDSK